MELTESSPLDRKSSSENPVSGKVFSGVAAPVMDQWSTKTPEKPISNRIQRSLLSLKDVREAAQKLRKLDQIRRELSDLLLSSDELKSQSISERKKHVNSVQLPEK